MNNNKKVIFFILTVTILYLSLSVFSSYITPYYPNFKNINLISDLLEKEVKEKKAKIKVKSILKTENKKSDTIASTFDNFEEYNKKSTIVTFNNDSLVPSLKNLEEKLALLAQNKKVKIRIAWFGDSQIEGDFITQDLRNLLQNYFGKQKGVGFMPINSVSSESRHTAQLNTVGNIQTRNLREGNAYSHLFLSGYSYTSDGLSIDFKDNTIKNPEQLSQKWLLYGKGDSIAIEMNDSIKKYPAATHFNRVLIDHSKSTRVKFKVVSNQTPIYGVSSEPASGLVLDNFSFRGISGIELKKIDTALLKQLNETGYYDLIVFQYGVNLMYKPNTLNYDYYYKGMKPVIRKFKRNLNKSDFLLLSCSDRAFRYNNQWETAIGIDTLIGIQARLAYENKIPFYNFYESMGGKGTIVKWADSIDQHANKDYIHFNHKGSKVVANMLFKAFLNDYEKMAKKKTAAEKQTPKKTDVNTTTK
jgi:lysophospholipase L1-like esterase